MDLRNICQMTYFLSSPPVQFVCHIPLGLAGDKVVVFL